MSDDLLDMSPEDQPEPDVLYDDAVYLVATERRCSTAWLQRQLKVGYNRVARIVERMEDERVVTEPDARGRREVLVSEPKEKKPRRASDKAIGSPGKADARVVQALLQPVSITFLAQVLKMERRTVTKRLAALEPISHHRGNTPLYDFRQAVAYLVNPKMDVAEAIKKMGTDDLPTSLQKDVWDAKLKAQKWMVNAGELWPTEDVLEVLGEAFQRLKTTTQLWIDQIGDNHMLATEARKELADLVDGLQKDLHRTLLEMPKEKATRAQLGELDGSDLDDG